MNRGESIVATKAAASTTGFGFCAFSVPSASRYGARIEKKLQIALNDMNAVGHCMRPIAKASQDNGTVHLEIKSPKKVVPAAKGENAKFRAKSTFSRSTGRSTIPR